MSECRELAAWAQDLPTTAPAASDRFITARIEYMEATLPMRNIDEGAGQKRVAVYLAILRGKSRKALQHMADEACRRLKWFPTPSECLELIAEFREPPTEREITLRICSQFAEVAFEGWLANLSAGQPIGDVPDRWISIAVERGPLRRLQGGQIVSRALYHGPYLPLGGRQ